MQRLEVSSAALHIYMSLSSKGLIYWTAIYSVRYCFSVQSIFKYLFQSPLKTLYKWIKYNSNGVFPKVAESPNPPTTVHCRTCQVNNCPTISTIDLYGKNLFPSTRAKCLVSYCDFVPTTLVLNQGTEAVLINYILTTRQWTINRTSLPVPQIFEERLCTTKWDGVL
jgi:hypothetical protein